MCQVQHTVVLHETNLSMFALLSVDKEEGNLAIVHRESVPGGGYRSVISYMSRKYTLSIINPNIMLKILTTIYASLVTVLASI